jgi:ornithine decarboxylase
MISTADEPNGLLSVDDGIFYRHPEKRLTEVMADMCQRHPEESFCFLNERALHDRGRYLLENFGDGAVNNDYTVAYAVKANARRRILEVLTGAGISVFDCASPNEIQVVQAVNPDARILYNHPVKSRKKIRAAIAMGVSHFTVQSCSELTKILGNSGNNRLEVVVRMETPNIDAAIDFSPKFGASKDETEKLLNFIRVEPNVKGGISVHTGSQNKNPETFRDAISLIAGVEQVHSNVHFINIGGGIPVNYFPDDRFDIVGYMKVINRAIKELLGDGHEIIIELGRSIVAESVDLVIPVTNVEERNGKKCVYIEDGLFTCFSDSAVHGWRYNFQAYSPHGKKFTDIKDDLIVFGETCDSGDVIHDVNLPMDIEEGDYLRVGAAGAYLDCQATHFCGLEPPKYVSYNSLT